MSNKILDTVNDYYTQKVREFGVTPKGVDWNSEESQELRFGQLCQVIKENENFSVLDYGCGYGAMLDFLAKIKNNYSYIGLDISEEMIKNAVETHKNTDHASWRTQLADGEAYDYTIASGIFNVRLGTRDHEWEQYILDTLVKMNSHSTKGFSFNMLTSYSDKEYMRDYLYYADPARFFDFCKRNFSKYVAVLHDYPLYEFTITVKK
jgi:cyclopropane fatty-acyl-phospholipid synthase-like methyltransferase